MKIAVILATVAIATVEAAWQCRCESRDSVKAGINEICRQLKYVFSSLLLMVNPHDRILMQT